MDPRMYAPEHVQHTDESQRVEAAAATNGKKEWTRDRAIAAIQEFHREHGRPPRQAELRLPLPSASFLYREFGGHAAAVTAAGLKPGGRGRRRAATKPPPVEKPAEPAMPEPAAAITLVDKARDLVQLAEQLERARAQVDDLEAQIRQIAAEIAA